MNITVNGEAQAVGDGLTLAQLVTERLPAIKGVAAAVDGAGRTPVDLAGRRAARGAPVVELLTAVHGG